MRRDTAEDFAFRGRFLDDIDLARGEITHAPVDELAGAARCARRDVVRVDQRHAQAAQGRVPGDAAAGDARADDEEVVHAVFERAEKPRAVAKVQGCLSHR